MGTNDMDRVREADNEVQELLASLESDAVRHCRPKHGELKLTKLLSIWKNG